MKNLAPEIIRQRLLIEGLYSREINEAKIESYLLGVALHLNLQSYCKPIIHSPDGVGKDENQGFDAFLPLIDSGISLYVWRTSQFFAIVVFTCKEFDVDDALSYTQEFFNSSDIEYKTF